MGGRGPASAEHGGQVSALTAVDSAIPQTSKWFVRYAPRPDAAVIVYCLPHAGGAASAFRTWHAALPEWIDLAAVRLPGRESRIAEPPAFTAEQVAQEVVADSGGRPFAVFGHSMGGRLAFEIGRLLAGPEPLRHLAISGIGHPAVLPPPPGISESSDADLAAWLTELGGVPSWALDDEQYRDLLLRTVRADCAWLESRVYTAAAPLACGLSVFAGADDAAAPPAATAAWARETAGRFTVRRYPGGHFYLDERSSAMLGDLAEDLAAYRDE